MTILTLMGLFTGFGFIFLHKRKVDIYKRHNKYERRNKIIAKSWNIINEISKWDVEHPKHIETQSKGITIFKGGSDLMTTNEFSNALRIETIGVK